MKNIYITALIALLPLQALSVVEVDSSNSEAIVATAGGMQYEQTGIDPKTGTSSSVISLEWAHYVKKDLAPFVGYRLAADEETSRPLYQAGFVGVRYFPFSLGMPVSVQRHLNTIRYDFKYKPYIEMGGSIGRYLVRTIGEDSILDASSEFNGFFTGLGLIIAVSGPFAADMRVLYEYDKGYGPFDFAASTIFMSVGIVWYL